MSSTMDPPRVGCPTWFDYVKHSEGSQKRTHPAMQCFFDTTEGGGSNTTFGVAEKLAGLRKQFGGDRNIGASSGVRRRRRIRNDDFAASIQAAIE